MNRQGAEEVGEDTARYPYPWDEPLWSPELYFILSILFILSELCLRKRTGLRNLCTLGRAEIPQMKYMMVVHKLLTYEKRSH